MLESIQTPHHLVCANTDLITEGDEIRTILIVCRGGPSIINCLLTAGVRYSFVASDPNS
ncbi:MAG: hypothetical protein FD153_1029 [Rhodospirillaceae bacterium]|nr:MAG: hypothetical protein FD153_1029 [Rhodospirillaceae bacterium]